MENKYCLITTTCDNMELCDLIIKTLLKKRLVSCVQEVNIKSSYRWKDKIENSNEILLLMKSKTNLYKELESEVLKLHNYETPQIVMYEIRDGFKGYLDWIGDETK